MQTTLKELVEEAYENIPITIWEITFYVVLLKNYTLNLLEKFTNSTINQICDNLTKVLQYWHM